MTKPLRDDSGQFIPQERSACAVEECGNPASRHGYCESHYHKLRRYGDARGGVNHRNKDKVCAMETCDRNATTRGWCQMHYSRWRKTGDPAKVLSPEKKQTLENAVCTYSDCDKAVFNKGLCNTHYYAELKQAKRDRGELCAWPRCEEPPSAGGLCNTHYARAIHSRELEEMLPPRLRARRCSEEGCENPNYAIELCRIHYSRYQRNGHTEYQKLWVPLNPQRLEVALAHAGLSRRQVAAGLGISNQGLAQQVGAHRISDKHAPELAEILGVSLEWLGRIEAPQLNFDE